MEVEIACGSVDTTWVKRQGISAQTFIHLTQLKAALVFAIYLDILTVAVAQSSTASLTLRDPMDYRMPGFPVLYHLPEFAQNHIH